MEIQDHSGTGGRTLESVSRGLKTVFPARAEEVTPSNITVFDYPSAIYVGTGGTVVVTPASSETPGPITFVVPDGGMVPVMCTQVRAGGSASNIVRVW